MDGVTDMSLLSEALSEAAASPSADEQEPRGPQHPQDPRKSRDPQDSQEPRDSRDPQEPRDSRDPQEPQESPSEQDEPQEPAADSADWAVSFEQFVASVLTEPLLVSFFERRADVSGAVAQLRSVRLNRQTSLSFSTSPAEAGGPL